ncbi:MAG: PBP1A family penicillin-binding protein [Alphaproteobacteria bacterium]|nr:PBP1A family penicillin-binding protein [Alphaproteobacteria bacterium]
MTFSLHPNDRLGVEAHEPVKVRKKASPPPPPQPPHRANKRSLWRWLGKWFCILLIWGSFLGGCFVLWHIYDLPDITKLQKTERRPSLTVLAKDGTKLATYGDLHGEMVDIKKLPLHVTQAILAIEDRRFNSHFGVDFIGLIRALWVNYRAGHVVQGGSTITQQLAKNFLQSEKRYDVSDRSLRRKIQEALLALWLEHKFSKDQILTIYLNRVYLGSGTFGLPAAAQHYFGKSPKDLTLYEAAVIAGLLKAPSKYSPSNNPQLADQRAAQVLENMQKEGFISEGAKEASLALASSTSETFRGSAIRYFTDWIVDSLPNYVDMQDKDLVVTTTLDPHLQSLAEAKLQEVLEEKGEAAKVSQMALVSLTHEGAVRALVGGVNYKKSQFNRATQALRQPGSIFKLVVYLAAIESGMTPSELMSDLPIRIGKWQPKNYLYKTRGEISLQDALAHSVNTVTVRLALKLGLARVVQTARRLGIKSALPDDLSIALGTGETTLLELTSVFGIIARNGLSLKPYAVLKITDLSGRILYTYKEPTPHRIVHPSVAREMAQMLQAVMSYGTGKKASIGPQCAGKTGTSQLHRDAWLVGFTSELITGTWAGNDDNTPMNPAPGSPAARLWHLFMSQTPQNLLSQTQEIEQSVDAVLDVDSASGGLLDSLIDSLFGG